MKTNYMARILTLLIIIQPLISLDLGFAGEPPGHRVRRERPIEMGVSGGNVNNRTIFSCCSGTIGGLLSTADGLVMLSNNHIFGRNFDDSIGEDVDQPGIIERACGIRADDFVGVVSALVPVDFAGGDNVIDAAIATPLPGTVREDGFILEIGIPSSVPVEAAIGMSVKKSGRTTGLTFGTIAAVNVTANVQASQPCGVVDGIARYVNQIRITPGSFIAGGDSGSLLIEDRDECPRVVGLLFAGSLASAVANPIQPVLDAFGAEPVGCPAPASAEFSNWELTSKDPRVVSVIETQEKYNNTLLNVPGVVGTGVGLSSDGTKPILEIYVENPTPELDGTLPKNLDGTEIKLIETGQFEAF